MQHGDEPASACGKEFPVPVELETLPTFVRMIVDDHLLNYPASDLIDVMTVRNSFSKPRIPNWNRNRSERRQTG